MNRQNREGYTLVEVVIATTLLTGIVIAIYGLFSTGVSAYGSGASFAEVRRNSDRVLELITNELSEAGRDVVYPMPVPPTSSSRITLQRSTGFAEGEIVWSPTTIIEFRHLPDDPDDGKDNNGNGLIDEGMVVRVDNAGTADEHVTVLTRWVREYLEGEVPNGKDDNGNGLVDEPGLCFDVIGEVWTIRLTLERSNSMGRKVLHTVQTSTKTRN